MTRLNEAIEAYKNNEPSIWLDQIETDEDEGMDQFEVGALCLFVGIFAGILIGWGLL